MIALRLNAPVGAPTDAQARSRARKPKSPRSCARHSALVSQQRAIVPLEPRGGGPRSSRWPGTTAMFSPIARSRGSSVRAALLQPAAARGSRRAANRWTYVEDIARYFADQIRAFRPDRADHHRRLLRRRLDRVRARPPAHQLRHVGHQPHHVRRAVLHVLSPTAVDGGAGLVTTAADR